MIERILDVIGKLILLAMMYGILLVLLWNWLMVSLFHLPEITFFEACGLRFMIYMLFNNA